jgi:hypothetical protein
MLSNAFITTHPCTSLKFLAIELDTTVMEACLPPEKFSILQDTFSLCSTKQTASLQEVQELTGFLHFASQVIPHSRAFLCCIIDFSTTSHSPYAIHHIPAYAHPDIAWWYQFACSWNSKKFIEASDPTVHTYTDASGTKGLGGIFESL